MALVGHTAASLNIFLEIPHFIRGLSQSLYGQVGPGMQILSKTLDIIQDVSLGDLTNIVEKYAFDWWNHENDWETHPLEVDHIAAYNWHIETVNEILYFVLNDNICPDRQYGYTDRLDENPLPDETSCASTGCSARLLFILGKIQKANRITNCIMAAIEEDRSSAARHVQHLRYLKEYQKRIGERALTSEDINKLYNEGMGRIDKCDEVQESDTLTPQSLSFNGFSDGDSDYIP